MYKNKLKSIPDICKSIPDICESICEGFCFSLKNLQIYAKLSNQILDDQVIII